MYRAGEEEGETGKPKGQKVIAVTSPPHYCNWYEFIMQLCNLMQVKFVKQVVATNYVPFPIIVICPDPISTSQFHSGIKVWKPMWLLESRLWPRSNIGQYSSGNQFQCQKIGYNDVKYRSNKLMSMHQFCW